MQQLGVCTRSHFESALINPVPFLLKMRKNEPRICLSNMTVKEHHENLCAQNILVEEGKYSTFSKSFTPLAKIKPAPGRCQDRWRVKI
jgi:hypothetical protein